MAVKGARGRTCHTRETLRLAGCAQTPCWNSSRARARLPARASSMPQACRQQLINKGFRTLKSYTGVRVEGQASAGGKDELRPQTSLFIQQSLHMMQQPSEVEPS